MLADRIITGDVYFLGSEETNTNDDPGNGKDPRKPFATLDYALGKMTAGQGDYLQEARALRRQGRRSGAGAAPFR